MMITNWLEIDRVQVLVNGRQPEQYNFRKSEVPGLFRDAVVTLDETIRVMLQQDAHLIVVAIGENSNIEQGWGLNPYGEMHPVAYTNPIYVDVDRNGFQTTGDTLGHQLMTSARGNGSRISIGKDQSVSTARLERASGGLILAAGCPFVAGDRHWPSGIAGATPWLGSVVRKRFTLSYP